ncbi:HNH endonuclease [Candidatus Dojkabacteria bacterium]|nr:HNH endonuclease [Candidatus Dojkabacteria bacterium]
MRKVNKNFNAPPKALQRGFEEKKNSLLEQKSEHQFEGRIYNNATKQELKELYYSKCAYCESLMSDDTFTVEHYRPKKGSYSYYWLGYEWSNLLPVCDKCNNAKGDWFPVNVPSRVLPGSGKKCRIKTPLLLSNGDIDIDAMKANHPYLLSEEPYLLHPEIDEPKEFLLINYNGELVSRIEKDVNEYHYERAKQTIRIANLNREILIWKRRKIIEGFEILLKKQTVRFLEEIANQKDLSSSMRLAFFVVFEIIENQFNEEQEYTLTGWWIWENIKGILFNAVCKDNQEIEKMLDYALDLYIQSKC